MSKKHHLVLVHGLGQGAWCWYKIKTLLQSLGHQVTALDLAASGTNLKKLSDVHSILEYSEPLLKFMETIPSEEKVVLVGHSLGGLNIAYAMEIFPRKVSVAVFLTAYMPDTSHSPSYVIEKLLEFVPKDAFLDSQFSLEEGTEKPKVTIIMGPQFLSSMLYQLSPPEDYTLGITLLRAGSLFTEDLSTASKFSEEGYGSVNRAFIVSENDMSITEESQRWMITNYPVKVEKRLRVQIIFQCFQSHEKFAMLLWRLRINLCSSLDVLIFLHAFHTINVIHASITILRQSPI